MKYYIQLSNGMETFRLQKNGEWISVKSKKIKESDFLTDDLKQLQTLQMDNLTITVNNKIWNTDPKEMAFGGLGKLYYDVYVSRSKFPETPSLKQLVATIKKGDDSISNSLVLDVDGKFELKNFKNLAQSKNDPTIVVRNEAWSAGNRFVGEQALEHMAFIEQIYLGFLESWVKHLNTGITNTVYNSMTMGNLEDLYSELGIMRSNFKST